MKKGARRRERPKLKPTRFEKRGRFLVELQRLRHDDLLVVAEAAPKRNRGRDDNGASYQETHGSIPGWC